MYKAQHIKILLHLTFFISFILFFNGCSQKQRTFEAAQSTNYDKSTINGFENIRFWGDEPALFAYNNDFIQRLKNNKNIQNRIDILALSGGAEDGAYGAGFLNGWSQKGDRPEFTIVTGISTGALIAPFAFLGKDYDHVLKRLYTNISKDNIYFTSYFEALFGTALGDTTPLRTLLEKEIDDNFVKKLAQEAKKGRVLMIGTTNLDAQRPVTWIITKIAASGHPNAKKLIQDIMLASTSIPGMFSPVLIEVQINGKKHHELHVDGGVTRQIFTYSEALNIKRYEEILNISPNKNMWLIRNTKINPEYMEVPLGIGSIVQRSMSTLLKYQGRNNLENIILVAKRDGFKVHLTNVPQEFNEPLNESFDTRYMQELYQVGYDVGKSEKSWGNNINYNNR